MEKNLLEHIEKKIDAELKKDTSNNLEEKEIKKKNYLNNKSKIKKKLDKLANLYLEDMIELEIYKKEYSILKEELNKIENETITEEKKDLSKLKDFLNSNWREIYDTLENKEKRELWMSIIDKIIFESKEDFKINLKLY